MLRTFCCNSQKHTGNDSHSFFFRVATEVAEMDKKTERTCNVNRGKSFSTHSGYLSWFSKQFPHIYGSNECLLNSFYVFHRKIMKMGNSSHLFSRKVDEILSTSRKELIKIFIEVFATLIRDKSCQLFSKFI